MHIIPWLVGATMTVAASASGAQPTPQSHEQHQATGQHQATTQHEAANAWEKCCCEQMMRDMHDMMAKMMQMHQGMGMMSKEAPQPDKEHAH